MPGPGSHPRGFCQGCPALPAWPIAIYQSNPTDTCHDGLIFFSPDDVVIYSGDRSNQSIACQVRSVLVSNFIMTNEDYLTISSMLLATKILSINEASVKIRLHRSDRNQSMSCPHSKHMVEGENSLRPYSQQRQTRTNPSCCLGLIDNSPHKSTDFCSLCHMRNLMAYWEISACCSRIP